MTHQEPLAQPQIAGIVIMKVTDAQLTPARHVAFRSDKMT